MSAKNSPKSVSTKNEDVTIKNTFQFKLSLKEISTPSQNENAAPNKFKNLPNIASQNTSATKIEQYFETSSVSKPGENNATVAAKIKAKSENKAHPTSSCTATASTSATTIPTGPRKSKLNKSKLHPPPYNYKKLSHHFTVLRKSKSEEGQGGKIRNLETT